MHKPSILSLTVVFLILPALIMGCATAKCCATAKFKFDRVNQPVMLGSVSKIGGSDTERGRLKMKIDINSYVSSMGRSGASGKTTGSELMKLLTQLSRTDEAREKIVIDKIYFGIVSTILCELHIRVNGAAPCL